MPELPEVEHTARQLRETIVGATIADAQVFWERTIGHPDLPEFLADVQGKRIAGVRRRGKLLILDLSDDALLTIHRRMTGNLLLLPPGWEIDTSLRERDPAAWNTRGPSIQYVGQDAISAIDLTRLRYCRVCFNLADGRRSCILTRASLGASRCGRVRWRRRRWRDTASSHWGMNLRWRSWRAAWRDARARSSRCC